MLNKSVLGVLLALTILICYSEASAQSPSVVIKNTQQSVVKVASSNKVGSGFLWKNRNWIVTSLHLIANKNDITVTTRDGVRKAKVVRILRRYDLALLELSSPVGNSVPVLSIIGATNNLNTSVYSIGYNGNGNLNNIIDRALRLGHNSSGTLAGLLPPAVSTALRTCKRPDPDIAVLYLEGTLLPGFSGAPIIDGSGKLIGIADGGLERGASSISWAISAAQLADLEKSAESTSGAFDCGVGATVTFSSDIVIDDVNVKTLEFDRLFFVKTKTRSVKDMMLTIDDTAGLNYFLRAYTLKVNFDYAAVKYDIYEEITTGAAFCVPEGASLRREGDLIKARFSNDDFIFISWLVADIPKTDTPMLRHSKYVTRFQAKIIEIDGGKLTYTPDYTATYASPFLYASGFVNRVAYQGFRLDTASSGKISYIPTSYSYQTLVGMDDKFFGVAIINHASEFATMKEVSDCLQSNDCKSPTIPKQCVVSCKRMEIFTKLLIGTFMSGMVSHTTK